MTDGEKYINLCKCKNDYYKVPHSVEKVEIVKTGREDYPEILEIHWKSGGKSGIGNKSAIEAARPFLGDLMKMRQALLDEIDGQMKAIQDAAAAEAEKTRPWTYVLGVLDDSGNRVEKYSWYEDNSWELYGNTDDELLRRRIESCNEFRSQSTSRWHVYKRMRGDTKLTMVY